MSRSAGFVAGVDCSTQATKVLIVEVASGRIVAEGRAPHEVIGTGGARETHPLVWWDALRSAMAETGMADQVNALAVAGQQHGLVTLDKTGESLRPAMLWNDTRSSEEARWLIDAWGGPEHWAETIGLVPVASFTVTKWLWLRHNDPNNAKLTRRVLLPHDYLNHRLSGDGATDRGDASGTGWWSTATEDYSPDVLELVEMDRALLPDVTRPGQAVGEISREAADALGLTAGAPVGPGTGDNMAAALGLGTDAGVPVVSLGTSGTAYAVSAKRTVDPSGTVAGFATANEGFLPLAATLNCTLAVERVASWLGLDFEQAADDTDVVMLPYFDGERTPNLPKAAGSIHGLRHGTAGEEILLAAYQGAASSLIEALDAISRAGSGIDTTAPLVLIGGGAKGKTWQRVIAQLAQRQVVVPGARELVAMGAAVQAASLLTGEAESEIARRWGTMEGPIIDPPSGGQEVLDRIRSVRETVAG